MKSINFRLPRRFEYFLLVLGFIFFGLFDYAQNAYQSMGGKFGERGILGFTLISTFFIFLFLYLIVVVIAIVHSLMRRGTHFYYDFGAGMIMLLGLYFIVAGGIAAIYFQGNDPIPWLFKIPQITVYHTLGVLAQVIGWIWFFITD